MPITPVRRICAAASAVVNDVQRQQRLMLVREMWCQQATLDAARGAFASDGLAIPLDEIARRAGVGPGTVYRHYPTKDALFTAVILDVLESVRDHAGALAKSPTQERRSSHSSPS
jgi:hypothetical protein